MNKDTQILKAILTMVMGVIACGVAFSWLYYDKLGAVLIVTIFICGVVFDILMAAIMAKLDDLEEERRAPHGSRKKL